MKHLRTLLLPALLLIPAASHAANTAPEAVSQSVNTPEDKGKVITLTASDVDAGSALSYTIVTRPANGTLVGTGPTQLYVPLANFNGSDSFTFTASDGVLDSPPATVSITVDPVAEPALDGPAFPEFVDPNPSGGNGFGTAVIPLNTGNVVITSPNADISGVANCGAVYLFNGSTGALISTLTGSTANDQVGGTSATGVMALASGNFVVLSPNWDNGAVVDAGAATWGNGTTGVSGAVSAANSLVGSKATDQVGSGATVLTNGNYVVRSVNWDNGAISNAGAVTWGSGTAGVSGAVSAANSLVGPTANDNVGLNGVTALTNGNYVVLTGTWDNGAVMNVGAATWRSGTTATSGTVSAANSLVGTKANDNVGSQNATALANGNYVVRSTGWDNGAAVNAGAVTWGNGTTGVSGVVGPANSLVGSKTDDSVGSPSVTALANGSYVVVSQNWDNVSAADAGAATWGSGTAGVSGAVSAANSLVGSTANNSVGTGGVTVLTNGNYVVRSQNWDNGAVADVGAATWGSGTAGVSGAVNATNSLIGSTASDNVSVGGVTALANGSYVVRSQSWDNGAAVNAGAATWGSGTAGVSGAVSAANSLVGSTANDFVGGGNFTVLANGNYVVASWYWDNGAATDAGAATWGSGTAGVSGAVSAANSL
ncbi:MAG: Ig-like domain-containing protein, partial [Verrucomicrobiota bacterium]